MTPGAAGAPILSGFGALDGGDTVTVELARAAPGAPVLIVIGLSALQLPFKGGILVPQVDALIGGLSTNGDGELVLATTWPTLPSGTAVFLQDWILDGTASGGLSASNGLRALVP